MRIRSVKPMFWQHRMHQEISLLACCLALALLNLADDEGRFDADPEMIRSLLFTYRRVTSAEIEAALLELADEDVGFVKLYLAPFGKKVRRFGFIATFRRHQHISHPSKSNLPPPPRKESLLESSGKAPGTLPESSGNLPITFPFGEKDEMPGHSHNVPVSCDHWIGKEGKEVTTTQAPEGHFGEPPSLAEVLTCGQMRGIPEDVCRSYFDSREAVSWLNRQQRMMTRREWEADLRGYWRRWESNAAVREKKTGRDVKLQLAALEDYAKGHPANEQSSAWSGDPTPEEQADLEKTRSEIQRLKKQMRGEGKP